MRVLSPLFERLGVSLVLSGHEHVYQRTRPFTFVPAGPGGATAIGTGKRLVPGTFTIDTAFDGQTTTTPRGIIYITTGAGGKELYDPGFTNAPEQWLHDEDNRVAYNAAMYTDLHSFSVIDIDGRTLHLRQVDENGKEVDRVTVTRSG
jgi:acid phosphatase type 7